MRKIIDECYKVTQKIISENKDLLDLIANTLLERETITKEQIDYLVEHGHMPDEEVEKEEIKELSLEDLNFVKWLKKKKLKVIQKWLKKN